jgi:hypothetical protein
MSAEGGEPAQVTRNGGFSPFESTDGRVIYYQKTQGLSDIWKVPVEGGEETKVVDSVGHRQFTVVAGGIYCIRIDASGQRLQFFDFATGPPQISQTWGPLPAWVSQSRRIAVTSFTRSVTRWEAT